MDTADTATIATGGLGAALALLAAAIYAWTRSRLARRDAADDERRDLEEQLRTARAQWSAANFCGDAARAVALRRRIDYLKRRLGAVAVLAAALALAAGCAARPAAVRTVILSDHCRTVAPGDEVPPLPAGEPHWWLCTPTGLDLLLPADAERPVAATPGKTTP